MRILLDMDDVMIDFIQRWVDVLNEKYNKNVKYTDVFCWSMQAIYPDLSHEDIFRVLFEDDFWRGVRPKCGAVKYVKQLIDDGHEVYIVTASHPITMPLRQVYVLEKYFSFIPHENIIMAHKKQMISGDILVDDNPRNLIGGDYISVLMTAPHNKYYPIRLYGLKRVNSWEEIYGLIKSMDESGVKE